ncbi:RusA family crossover junction endodeoxyribonuclease [Actinomyces sp. MRS3W]|uniref:RusA family crossover junction endodeoxyribonuclease n=1 Tax=Actinomyces sp. MRS3W TaxID=2800796 RepID=UPI0028FD9ADC|nr:RusA family crossover junction endodeoxyribonuclease [Actinomyces sp. MRS3W]MDU0348310.1 RusA family crossover junction endodeoxyribonuclease [Actinomyces sp. MRS3W]
MTTTATTAPPTVAFAVDGMPETEGSTRAFPTQTGGVRVTHTKQAALEEWRARVRAASLAAAVQARWPLGYDGPVEVRATFYLPRPARPRFPVPATKPDLDKLERAVGDALAEVRRGGYVAQRGLLREDSRIVRWHSAKEYVDGEVVKSPGAAIAVLPVDEETQP